MSWKLYIFFVHSLFVNLPITFLISLTFRTIHLQLCYFLNPSNASVVSAVTSIINLLLAILWILPRLFD